MSDWDFLHDMHHEGYSAEEIADAAAVGYAPWQEKYIDFGPEPKKQASQTTQPKVALQGLEQLRQSGVLTRPQFLACKAAILKQKAP